MKQILSPAKLENLIELMQEQPNTKRLADAIINDRLTGVTSITTKDPGGSHLEYYAGVTLEAAKAKSAIRVTKQFVEEFDKAAIELDAEVDVDSVTHRLALLTSWIRTHVRGTGDPITENDVVSIISASGSSVRPNFVFEVKQNGTIIDTGNISVKRLTTDRVDIKDIIGQTTLGVNSLRREDIIEQILLTVDETETDFKLFAEDISIPATHLKENALYQADIKNTAFQVYGSLSFILSVEH